MRVYRKFSKEEQQQLMAAFELKRTLTHKALARKFNRSVRAIECLHSRLRSEGKIR
jgi:hypothetical protein